MSSGLGIGVTKTSSPVLSFLFAARFRKGKPALTTLYMPHAVGTCLSSKGPLAGFNFKVSKVTTAERCASFPSISSSSGCKQLGWGGMEWPCESDLRI